MAEVQWDRQKFLAHRPRPKCDCKIHVPCPCSGGNCRLCFFDPRHGTENAYNNQRCRCELCRAAHAVATYKLQENRIKKMQRGEMPEELHGTPGGYGNWGCRCRRCTLAWNEDTGERAKRSRRGLTDCAQGLMPKPKRRRQPLNSEED